MSNRPKHILVIRLSAMGDVAMAVPVLRAFTEQFPEVRLTVLTKSDFIPFFRDLDNVTVFPAEIKGRHKGILGIWRLSKDLKLLNLDAVADFHNVIRSNILKLFLGKPFVQIDKGRKEKRDLVSGKIFRQLKFTHQRYLDVLKKLGYKVNLANPSFPKKKLIHESIKNITGEKKNQWIGIAPFAAHKSKMYPLQKMRNVIEELSKDYKVFLFGGGKDEVETLDEIAKEFSNTTNLAGKLNLSQELDIISNLDLMLSMDSGNGHIASMLGVPVVTIWGVTHPYAGFKPFNQPVDNSITIDRTQFPLIPTSIYGNKYPKEYENCAGTIAEAKIIEKCKSLL